MAAKAYGIAEPPLVRVDALVLACLASLAVGFAGELGWRWLAVHALDVSASLTSIQGLSLVMGALIPVIGNGLGYFMVYRHHVRRATLLFLGPGAAISCVAIAISLLQLAPSPSIRDVIVTIVVGLIAQVVTVTILLTRRQLRGSAEPVLALLA